MIITSHPWRILKNLLEVYSHRLFLTQISAYAACVREKLRALASGQDADPISESLEMEVAVGMAEAQFGIACLLFKAAIAKAWAPARRQKQCRQMLIEATQILMMAAAWEPDGVVLQGLFQRFRKRYPDMVDMFIVCRAIHSVGISPDDYIAWVKLGGCKDAYFAIQTELLLEEKLRPVVAEPSFPRPRGILTHSQFTALTTLKQFHSMKLRAQRIAGIDPRPIPLIVGPSGSGKTHVVWEFARESVLPVFDCSFGTWTVTGNRTETNTLKQIAEFIRTHLHGIIFIDEVDKLAGQTDWARCITQEVYALLDGRTESFDGWTEEERKKLRHKFLLIGAGTWQHLFSSAGKNLGFGGNGDSGEIDLDRQTSIEPELLFRFNANVIFLEPPGREEFRERIVRIQKELDLEPLEEERLSKIVEEAMVSGKHHRFLEAYVTHLLMGNSTKGSKPFHWGVEA